MSRYRRALTLALAAASVSPRTWAQKPGKVARIGVVGLASTADLSGPQPRSPSAAALLRGLRELGYTYGVHYVTVAHGASGNPAHLEALAAELVRQRPDVIVATGAAVPALKAATSTIPIVMTATTDPVETGLVQSLVRPGGNLTGMSLQGTEGTAKRLQMLKELVPGSAPVGVVWNRQSHASWVAARAAARQKGWPLVSLEIVEAASWEPAFHAAVAARVSGVLVLAAAVLFPRAKMVAALAARLKLPAVYELRPYVEAGGLMSYGPDIIDIWRRAAVFADKILDGAKAADIPVEQPTRFELVVNQPAAKELGLSIPQSLLVRADEVIG